MEKEKGRERRTEKIKKPKTNVSQLKTKSETKPPKSISPERHIDMGSSIVIPFIDSSDPDYSEPRLVSGWDDEYRF
jgi:hypothetical protein